MSSLRLTNNPEQREKLLLKFNLKLNQQAHTVATKLNLKPSTSATSGLQSPQAASGRLNALPEVAPQ